MGYENVDAMANKMYCKVYDADFKTIRTYHTLYRTHGQGGKIVMGMVHELIDCGKTGQ